MDSHSFNPLDRGNLYLIINEDMQGNEEIPFQSPRSGKFVSNFNIDMNNERDAARFNPLDRGNLYLIRLDFVYRRILDRFNPLDRGNLYLIKCQILFKKHLKIVSIP